MNRKTLLILSIVVIGALWGCDSKEKLHLQSQVDSLRVELETNQNLAQTLQDVGSLLDSIDVNRKILRTEMVEGTSYTDYTARLQNINNHVRATQQKIMDMEESLAKSNSKNKSYLATIKRLKADLESSTLQIATLQNEVETIRAENQTLADRSNKQQIELNEKLELIQMKEKDLAALEVKVNDISSQATANQADLYFAEAEALETAAHRTKFAPKKKKETQREALELYKVALSLGKIEAQRKIEELEKVLG